MKKEFILDQYIKLAKQLGRFPNSTELLAVGITKNQFKHYHGNMTNLKNAALVKDASLVRLTEEVKITEVDLEHLRLSLIKKDDKDHNKQVLISTNSVEYIKRFVEEMKLPKVSPYKPKAKKSKIDRVVTLFLSDLHIGADILREETGVNEFGKVEEARRLATLVKQTIEYKIQHRNTTRLEVILNGDIIQGMLGHDPRDGAPVAEQVARAIYLLTQAIEQFSKNFGDVTVRCSTGNHGRHSRHKQRATKQKWDSYETIIYYSLKTIFKDVKNVKVEIPKTPYISYEIFNKKVLVTHGDSVINVGNPSSSLNIRSIETQINKINASLKDLEEYALVLIGHVHSASISFLGNGTAVMTNACMVGADDFSVSIGSFETLKGQWLFESVPDIVLGDSRLIRLDDSVDSDSSLDKIIKPWENF